MTTQMALFARDEAIARVERGADDEWLAIAEQAVEAVAAGQREFTTDQVWSMLADWGVAPPREERAMGVVMGRAKRAMLAERTDRTLPSLRPACHCRPLAVWRAL